MKPCPFCAEKIKDQAIKCRHCGSMVTTNTVPKDTVTSVATNKANICLPRLWGLFFGALFVGLVTLCLAAYLLLNVKLNSGWALVFVALVAFSVAIMREFACSYCGKRLDVNCFALNKECEKCQVLHIITWQ